MPRLGERLLAGHDWAGLPAELAQRIVEAEAAVYDDPQDPMANWDDGDLAGWCAAAGLTVTAREVAAGRVEFPLGSDLLARWFGTPGGAGGTGGRLAGLLSEADAERARRHLETAAGATLTRRIAVALLAAERPA